MSKATTFIPSPHLTSAPVSWPYHDLSLALVLQHPSTFQHLYAPFVWAHQWSPCNRTRYTLVAGGNDLKWAGSDLLGCFLMFIRRRRWDRGSIGSKTIIRLFSPAPLTTALEREKAAVFHVHTFILTAHQRTWDIRSNAWCFSFLIPIVVESPSVLLSRPHLFNAALGTSCLDGSWRKGLGIFCNTGCSWRTRLCLILWITPFPIACHLTRSALLSLTHAKTNTDEIRLCRVLVRIIS